MSIRRMAVHPFTDKPVFAGELVAALIHVHAVNAITREVHVDEVQQAHIPIEFTGRCDHTETICTDCKDSWSLDYVFDPFFI